MNLLKYMYQYMAQYMSQFYKENKVYVWMLSVSLILIVIANIIVVYWLPSIIKIDIWISVGKVWEIASCLLTIAFTLWYWFIKESNGKFSKSGKQLIELIDDNVKRMLLRLVISLSLLLMLIVVCANIYFIIKGGHRAGVIGVIAVTFVFILFIGIDIVIIKTLEQLKDNNNLKVDITKELIDFKYALKNSDIPISIAFFALAAYAIFTYPQMELFFSGAIGFQLLYSTIIWANLDTI